MKEQNSIQLISFEQFNDHFLEEIAEDVRREYKCAVSVENENIDLGYFYDPVRRQYDGYKLLKRIDTMFPQGKEKKLGLFKVDLFIPILTYIFGQAVFDGNIGVASIHRLRNEHYGLKKDDALLLYRFKKVVIHELGHNFGLVHCVNPSCVMRSSTYVEDLDQKKTSLCSSCRNHLNL